MKKYLYFLLGAIFFAGVAYAAPTYTYQTNLLPLANDTYDLGSTSPALEWKNLYAKNITVSGTCTGCSSFSWPFTAQSYGNSTSTVLGVPGLVITGSTTLSNLGTGAVFTQNGLILSHATTSASAAYQDVWRDANQNAFAQNFVSAATTFPSLGTTATLTAASPRTWIVTGTNVQTFKLPNGTTISNGTTFIFNNNSTGLITIVDNGSNVLAYVLYGGSAAVVLTNNSTSNGSWDSHASFGHNTYSGSNNLSIATTSPFASLSIHANPTDAKVYTTLFAIGSSTASATTTLFSVSNIGSTTLFQIPSSILKTNANGTIVAAANGVDYTLLTANTCTAGDFFSAVTAAGVFTCTTPAGGSAYPFTPSTFGTLSVSATTTTLLAAGGVFGTSTIGSLVATSSLTSLGTTKIGAGTGLLLTTSGTVSNYAGTSCTNQFPRSLSVSGVATCATVANTDLANSSITINGSSVSLGGSITVASTTLLGDVNTWSKGQTFNGAATTTSLYASASTTVVGVLNVGGQIKNTEANTGDFGIVSPKHGIVLQTGTTTTWTATTSGAYIPYWIASYSGSLKRSHCYTDSSFLGTEIDINGTAVAPSYFVASSTVGTTTITGSNTFTVGDRISMKNGTTTTASALLESCTLDATQNS